MRRLIPLCIGLVAALPTSANASGFDAPHVGSAQSGPVMQDAAAAWWNPAELGYLKRTELTLGAGLLFGVVSYQRELRGNYQYADNFDFKTPVADTDIDPSKRGPLGKVRDIPVGPALDGFLAIPVIRNRWVIGGGISVPYLAVLKFPNDGPQRFAAQSLLFLTPHATLATGVKLHDVISIGAGVSYVFGALSLKRVQDFAGLATFGDTLSRPPIAQANDFGDNAPSEVRELDVLARPVTVKKMIAHGVTFNVGVALQPTKKLSLALTYHHGAKLKFRGQFRINFDDDYFTQDLAAQGLQYPAVVDGDATVQLRLPKRLTLGAGYKINDRISLDGFVSYVFYRDFDRLGIKFSAPELAQPRLGVSDTVEQDIIRNWKDTVNTELNARIQATKKLKVSVTAGYNSPASPTRTVDVQSPDGHRLIFGAGIAHTVSDRFTLMADLKAQVIVPRHVTDSDYDLGNGTYRLFLGLATLHGQFRFDAPKQKHKPEATKTAAGAP